MRRWNQVLARNRFLVRDIAAERGVHECRRNRLPHLVWGARSDRRGGTSVGATLQNMCLVTSLQHLGVSLDVQRSGPFWALEDGNATLAPHGYCLRPVSSSVTTNALGYVVRHENHFTGHLHLPDSLAKMQGDDKRVFALFAASTRSSSLFEDVDDACGGAEHQPSEAPDRQAPFHLSPGP